MMFESGEHEESFMMHLCDANGMDFVDEYLNRLKKSPAKLEDVNSKQFMDFSRYTTLKYQRRADQSFKNYFDFQRTDGHQRKLHNDLTIRLFWLMICLCYVLLRGEALGNLRFPSNRPALQKYQFSAFQQNSKPTLTSLKDEMLDLLSCPAIHSC